MFDFLKKRKSRKELLSRIEVLEKDILFIWDGYLILLDKLIITRKELEAKNNA